MTSSQMTLRHWSGHWPSTPAAAMLMELWHKCVKFWNSESTLFALLVMPSVLYFSNWSAYTVLLGLLGLVVLTLIWPVPSVPPNGTLLWETLYDFINDKPLHADMIF